MSTPTIGVAAIILRNRKILVGQRIGSHGAGTWGLPGGHLEFGESIEDCARREVVEETGLELDDITRGPYTSDVFPEIERHYLTLFVLATRARGEPRVLEPARCAEWRWVDWSGLPSPLFRPLQTLVASGYDPATDR